MTHAEIGKKVGCGSSTVSDIKQLYAETGSVACRNAPWIWPPSHISALRKIIEAASSFSLKDIALLLNSDEAIARLPPPSAYDQFQVCDKLKEMKLNLKTFKRRGKNRDPDELLEFEIMVGVFYGEQLVFFDETRLDPKDLVPKLGRAGPGQQPLRCDLGTHGRPESALAVCSCMGMLDYVVVEHGFNAPNFLYAFEHFVLPHVQEFPDPNSVLVCDNAPIHGPFAAQMQAMVEARGGILIWLARYGPENNPIEEMFHQTKAYIRNNQIWTDNVRDLYKRAFQQITPAQAVSYYRHAGYGLSLEALDSLQRSGRLQ